MGNNKKLIEELLKADGINPAGASESERIAFAKILDQQLKTKQSHPATTWPNVWRVFMKSKITKLAVAAVILVAAVLSINIMDKSVPTAFGIEQIIEAYNNIRFLHIKEFRAEQEEPVESWIKANEQGGIEKARYYLPEYISPEDGAKLIAWTPERAELWFKKKNGYLIFQTKKVEAMMQSLIVQCQPKLVMKKLLENQKAGIADINTITPLNKQEPVTIIVTHKNKLNKEIYYVNQATDLITSIEVYGNGKPEPISTTEFYDYNVVIDEKMFTLKDEVPGNVTIANYLDQLIGIPQGSMTYEQAATETVRQFFQALIEKDYKKAGQIFSGISEEKTKEYFSKLNVTAIVSIGTPTSYPKCGPHSYRVPIELEIIEDGEKKTISKGPLTRCGDDEMHPDRWIIHGGI